MNARIERIIGWLQSLATAFMAVISGQILTYLQAHKFKEDDSVLILFLLVLLAIHLTSFFIKWLISNSRFIRKCILGRYFIEGYWFDIVTVPEEKKLREYGLIEIDYDQELIISGILYDLNFRRIGSFSTGLSDYADQKVEYAYSRIAEHDKLEDASGLGEYIFTREKPWPLTFSGSFFDSELDKRVLVRGIRITDKSQINKIESNDPKQQVSVAQNEADIFMNQFPEYNIIKPHKSSL